MLTKITTTLVLTVALTAPVFAQSLDAPFRRNTYYQNFRPAPATTVGQPSTGQPSGLGAPANITSGNYSASYSGSYSNSYTGAYSTTIDGTVGGTSPAGR